MTSIAVIIPLLNEAEILPTLMNQLERLHQAGMQVIVVDGGSDDGTRERLAATAFHVIDGPRGRALQMNAGARHADAELLLFLHADTVLPDNSVQLIIDSNTDGYCWGRFDVQITGEHFMLPVIARMMNWRSRLTKIATGDQALFMRREIFQQVNGFPQQSLMEDIEISKQLKRLGRPACLRQKVTTSGRRWQENGVWKTILLMWRLRFDYWRGVDASQLAGRYQ